MDLTDSYQRVVPAAILARYELREVRNAAAVLQNTNPEEFRELIEVLEGFWLSPGHILEPGGNRGLVARELDGAFRRRGWREGRYDATIRSRLTLMPHRPAGERETVIVESEVSSRGYRTDNVKGRVALDVEWNAKDGNLDRDIGAYRSLYDSAIVDGAVVLTRTQRDLRTLGRRLGRDALATTTTTNLDKLEPRLARGDGGGCPILAIAITARCYRDA